MRKRENILLIVVDCLRADFVYKVGKALIPNIATVRAGGLSFLNTITVTSTTTPSFTSLLTGLYPYQHGVRSLSGYGPRQDLVFLTEVLRSAGYTTYAEVTGPLVEQMGLISGFDHYSCREPECTIHTGWGQEFLRRIKDHYREPWFVLLHVWSLHIPRVVIEECNNSHHGSSLYARALASFDQYLGKLLTSMDTDTLLVFTGDHGEQIAHSNLDALLKRLGRRIYGKLRQKGMTDLHFAKAMRWFHVGHGYGIYDVLIKVPLIFHRPGLVPAGQSPFQIPQIDILPTILELVNVPHEIPISGQSVLSTLEGSSKGHRDAYLEAVGKVIPSKDEWLAGIRVDNKYKYIHSPYRADYQEELYDLDRDPGELHNIASRNESIVVALRARIDKMMANSVMGQGLSEEDQKEMKSRLRALGYID
jgi:arylsulfatase A-like enzyme